MKLRYYFVCRVIIPHDVCMLDFVQYRYRMVAYKCSCHAGTPRSYNFPSVCFRQDPYIARITTHSIDAITLENSNTVSSGTPCPR